MKAERNPNEPISNLEIGAVIEVDGTLIKYRSGPYERILNTTSPHFHSAATQLVEDLR